MRGQLPFMLSTVYELFLCLVYCTVNKGFIRTTNVFPTHFSVASFLNKNLRSSISTELVRRDVGQAGYLVISTSPVLTVSGILNIDTALAGFYR